MTETPEKTEGDVWEPRKCVLGAEEGGGKANNRISTKLGTEISSPKSADEGQPSAPSLEGRPDSLRSCSETKLAIPEDLNTMKKAVSQTSVLSERGGSTLSFHNVTYKVKEKVGRCGCGKTQDKTILNNISGLFRPGLNAIMGPTGGGKTSLLDVLAGRKDPQGLSGKVLVDGANQPHNFKCASGYVIQDDIVMGMLTVRENIQFSAALRLPASMSEESRNQRVDEVIEELGLTKCANTKVGTQFMRGVSGGERKRTNMAMELITSPSVLFLDEPTTGLDSNTAYSVMHLLQRLARKGKTIIFSIHQPRYSIFKLFDNLILLSQGECVYHGPANQALNYFHTLGYECEPHNNPSDFFLDVLKGSLVPVLNQNGNSSHDLKLNGSEKSNGTETEVEQLIIDLDEDTDVASMRQKILAENFKNSTWNQSLHSELEPFWNSFKDSTSTEPARITYPTSFCSQLGIVSSRTFKNMIRNPHTLVTQVFSAIILGLIVGTIYFQIDDSYNSGIQNRVGAFFFIVMNYVFGNMAAVDIFIKERALFIHENVSGFYRVSVYFVAKLFCEVIPMRLIPIIVFSTVTYWMIGFDSNVENFLFYSLNIFLTSLSGTSVALILSASVEAHTIGTILTAMVWVFMMVFSGLLVNISSINPGLQWLQWLSIFRYSMSAFTVNELRDKMMCDNIPALNSTVPLCDSGNAYMERQGIEYQTEWHLWRNEVALLLLAAVFLLITYIQLRRINKLH